jgi:hypothetical protein
VSICTYYADFRNLFMLGEPPAPDGFPEWDNSKFNGTMVLYSNWQITFPITTAALTVADDAVNGTDEFHWYLAQPTELTEPRMELQRYDNLPTSTRSGRVKIALTAAGSALLASRDLGPPHSAEAMGAFLRGCYLYGYDIAASKYYVTDMWRAAFVPAQLDI